MQERLWVNGDPLSFQLWTNQQIRFGDITYRMMVWNFLEKEEPYLCGFKGVCPPYFVPTSSEKNTTQNTLLVKKFAFTVHSASSK